MFDQPASALPTTADAGAPPSAGGYVTDVAYLPRYYPFMAPARMRAVAAMHGIRPPAIHDRFSYLELGCGFGSTLLTLAAANPHGRFVGVDFMEVHTRRATTEAAACGLDNVAILHADFAALPADLGTFDFVALHGVFSWVSQETRRHILELIRRHLAPGGIVEVSYNCLPGWSSLLPVRMLLRHFAARADGDSVARVQAALEAVDRMRKADVPVFHDQPLAAQLVDRLLGTDPHYVAHEYLNEDWTVFEAADVLGQFAALGLGHAGRLPYHHNHWQLCANPRFADQFAGADPVACETLKDLHANVMFRWDLFSAVPRVAWSPRERAVAAPDLHFRIASPTASLPHTVTFGALTAGIAGSPHEEMLAVMGAKGWTLGDLLDHPQLSGVDAEAIVEAVDTGVAMGLFRIDGGPVVDPLPRLDRVPPGGIDVPLPFNRRALQRHQLTNAPVELASRRTGAGHEIGDLHALILAELIEVGSDTIDLRLADRLTAAGKHLREHDSGRPLTERGELVHACREICAEFLTTVLPELVRQGIVEVSPTGAAPHDTGAVRPGRT